MELEYGRRFARDSRRIDNRKLRENVQRKIEELERASSLWDVTGIKKLKFAGDFFRIRIGDYRLGIELKGTKVELMRFLHRRDFYRFFP